MSTRQSGLRLVVVLTLVLFGLASQVSATTPFSVSALTVSSPPASGVVLPEMDEFATTVMGDSWDMNEPTDLAYYRSESGMTNSTFANGIYSAQLTSGQGGDRITLLTMGAANHAAMRVGKIGYTFPIDAGYYRYLTFRMYSSNAQCNSGLIEWYEDDSYSNAVMGVSNGFLVPPLPCFGQPAGWYTYTLDLKTIGIQLGSKNWEGTIRELLLHPFAGTGAAGATVKLDWVRLTHDDPRTARPYTLQWTGDGTGGAVTLYARAASSRPTGAPTSDDIVIAKNQSASGGSFVFQTGILPAGQYYIAASNSGGTAWSEGPLVINAPPQPNITKPSKTSGQDFAQAELGNAWDMAESSDIASAVCLTSGNFSNGIYSAVVPSPICPTGSGNADPIINLNGSQSIDATKYRYLSYRFYHSGQQNVGEGWIARVGWASTTEATIMSRDVIILEDWNTYKLDMWADDVVDESYPSGTRNWLASHPNRIRFDPDELAAALAPATIQLDWVKLTAMDEVVQGESFPILYDLNATPPVTLTFYYDTDTDPSNGRTLIGSTSKLAQSSSMEVSSWSFASLQVRASSNYTTYLPLVARNYFDCSGNCYRWNTASVSPGIYYVCVDSRDAYNSIYRCSEAPVVIKSAAR
jgi:hypothetical protein